MGGTPFISPLASSSLSALTLRSEISLYASVHAGITPPRLLLGCRPCRAHLVAPQRREEPAGQCGPDFDVAIVRALQGRQAGYVCARARAPEVGEAAQMGANGTRTVTTRQPMGSTVTQ
jgi:hypothetical protein